MSVYYVIIILQTIIQVMDRQGIRSDSPDLQGPSIIQSEQSHDILVSKHMIPPPRMLLPKHGDNSPKSLLPMLPLPTFIGIIPNYQPLTPISTINQQQDGDHFNWIGDAFDNSIVYRKYEQASYAKIDDMEQNWNIWACDVVKLMQPKTNITNISKQPFVQPVKEEITQFYKLKSYDDPTLIFQSRFQSGNLSLVSKVTDTEYNLLIQSDINTNSYSQWFFFRVKNIRKNQTIKFNILNFYKHSSLYAEGMKIIIYSTKQSELKNLSWHRGGDNIQYFQNGYSKSSTYYKPFFTLSWDYTFLHDEDQVYFAYNYPFTYSNLNNFIQKAEGDPFMRKICWRTHLCKTLAGNNVDLLTITQDHPFQELDKKYVVITARIHPGETVSSFVCNGILQYLLSSSQKAKKLRQNFIFKIIPMMNPDGVIHGNYRSNISGFDLNRKWQNPSKHYHPEVYSCKKLIQGLNQIGEVILFCDLHGHSKKKNVFIYGSHNSMNLRNGKQFPYILSKLFKGFSFSDCSFLNIQQKQGTTRTVLAKQVNKNNVYTLESSFCGPEYDNIHFTVRHFEELGEKFCEALLLHFREQIKQMQIDAAMRSKSLFEPQRHDQSYQSQSQLQYDGLLDFDEITKHNLNDRVNSENSQGSEIQNQIETMLEQKTIKKYLIVKNTRPLTSMLSKSMQFRKSLSNDFTAKLRQKKLEFHIHKSNSPTRRKQLYEQPKAQKLIRPFKVQQKIEKIKLQPKLFEPIQFMSVGLDRKKNHRSISRFSNYDSQRLTRVGQVQQKISKSNTKLTLNRKYEFKQQSESMFKNTSLKGFIKDEDKKRKASEFIIRKNKIGTNEDKNSSNLFKSVLSSLRKQKR